MELVAQEIAQHRALADAPLLLEEILQHGETEDDRDENEKEPISEKGNQQVLHGGRLIATYDMAEMGQLRYSSDVHFSAVSPDGDDYEWLDVKVLERLREVTYKELDCLTSQCGNIILNSLLDGLCPDLVASRAAAVKAEEQAGSEVLNTPLFICTLAMPAMPTFLHVFEPRYRLMMRRVLEGNRQFGMVMYNRTSSSQSDLGPVPFLEYGTMLEIVNYELLRDGRSFVETRGIGRFKVRAHGMLDGYNVAHVERVEDVPLAEEATVEQRETTMAREFAESHFRAHPQTQLPTDIAIETLSTQQLLDTCTAFVREMREASAPWLRERIIQVYGEPPEDPALFPYWFASVVPVLEEEKYVLLRTTRVRERLKVVYSWIGRIRGQRCTFTIPALSTMAPKQLNGRGGRAAEPSFARSAIQGLTSAENRSVITSIGLFAVSLPRIQGEDDEMNMRDAEPKGDYAPAGTLWQAPARNDCCAMIGVTFLHSSWAEILLPA
ncbi:hypothetical protein E8E13_001573 [Curvularia kusanoi]|uniref:Lon N-terminal domain-containing protein n=1 Tax=Curvularia kusanoi TaxID=90978 RepID=A0A9P4TJQ1_CURKU|nr:hypothetical protein E8E13_001573 [Curvularia kusanoi]